MPSSAGTPFCDSSVQFPLARWCHSTTLQSHCLSQDKQPIVTCTKCARRGQLWPVLCERESAFRREISVSHIGWSSTHQNATNAEVYPHDDSADQNPCGRRSRGNAAGKSQSGRGSIQLVGVC